MCSFKSILSANRRDTGSGRTLLTGEKAFCCSHSDSRRWIILSTQSSDCQNTVNYYPIMFLWTSRIFMCWLLLFHWKEETGQHVKQTGVGYIRDGALHWYCCFILLTQLGKQPTLALSIQTHRLQRDPDSSSHTSASDKGSHGASGDGVKNGHTW